MKKFVEKSVKWMKENKTKCIVIGGVITTTAGVLLFKDNFRIVTKNHDIMSIAKDSIPYIGYDRLANATNSFGTLGLSWENSECVNIGIDDVVLSSLGNIGKSLSDEIGDKKVSLLVSYNK